MKRCPKCGKKHDGSQTQCKKCYAGWSRAWRRKNKDKAAKANADYRKRHPERVAFILRRYQLRTTYGITMERYDELFLTQGGRCAICRSRKCGGPGKHFHIDHCHKTKKVRGLLCCNCNFVVGHSLDDPKTLRLAADYLERTV